MVSSEKLKEAIEAFGLEIINVASKLIQDEPKVDTGRLSESLEKKVIATAFGTSFTLLILAADYFVYVDKGRRAGSKPPPITPIKEWCIRKGIDENLAYPISKAIGINGIPATNISRKMFEIAFSNAKYRQLEDGVADWVDDLIVENFKGISKKGNITFK